MNWAKMENKEHTDPEQPDEGTRTIAVRQFETFDEMISVSFEMREMGLEVETETIEREDGTLIHSILVAEADHELAREYLDRRSALNIEAFDGSPKCPKCESKAVSERELSFIGMMSMYLVFPAAIKMAREKISGLRYACRDCGHKYRYKL